MTLETLLEGAVEAARAHHWGDAALLYGKAAAIATDAGAEAPARRAWEAAGEAWRRDDQPEPAARALRMALHLPEVDGSPTSLIRLRLASVLAEGGNGDAARVLCRQALDGTSADDPVRPMIVDAIVGTCLGFGRKADARAWLPDLADPVARAFREGELLRLDGALAEARRRFEEVLRALDGRPEAEAGRAAALGELGEVSLLEGDAASAAGRFGEGAAQHREAGRRSLAWRCEAGRVRALVEGGAAVMVTALDDGVSFAIGRRMVLLEADLRIARGMALADRDPARAADDLHRAIAIADRCGTRLRAGRARYELAIRGLGARELLDEAIGLLDDSVVHRERAIAARG